MGWRIVLQPNGRLARFSDVVDDFTHFDLSEWEAVGVCIDSQCSPDEARSEVERGKKDEPVPGLIEDDGEPLLRWRDALHTVAVVHGYQVAADRERIGAGPCPACGGRGAARPRAATKGESA